MRIVVVSLGIVLVLGGLYFYQRTWNASPPTPKKSLEEFLQKDRVRDNETLPQNTQNSKDYPSLLARLFKPNIFISEPNQNEEGTGNTEVDKEREALKNEIRTYLIASSDIEFPESTENLKSALENAAAGDSSALINIRDGYQKGLGKLQDLAPPAPLEDIHAQSSEAVKRFIALLDDAIHQAKGSVGETWNSQERVAINSLAQQTKAAIVTVVEDYDIYLPPGVISY